MKKTFLMIAISALTLGANAQQQTAKRSFANPTPVPALQDTIQFLGVTVTDNLSNCAVMRWTVYGTHGPISTTAKSNFYKCTGGCYTNYRNNITDLNLPFDIVADSVLKSAIIDQ